MHQIKAADPPRDAERQRGQEIFLSKPCVMCHSVRGTPAGGRVAPDLTHLGSRQYIAAGTLPMSRGNLAAWIVDPQGIKPGVHMPLIKLEPDEVDPPRELSGGTKMSGSLADRDHGDLRDTALGDAELRARLAKTWGTATGIVGRLSSVDHKVDRPPLHRHGVRLPIPRRALGRRHARAAGAARKRA